MMPGVVVPQSALAASISVEELLPQRVLSSVVEPVPHSMLLADSWVLVPHSMLLPSTGVLVPHKIEVPHKMEVPHKIDVPPSTEEPFAVRATVPLLFIVALGDNALPAVEGA